MTSLRHVRRKDDVRQEVTGVIRSTFVIGPSAKIEHAWYGVRADGHADKVLATLRS